MIGYLVEGFDFLTAQTPAGLMTLYWFVLLFEIPRYGVAFLVAALFIRSRPCSSEPLEWTGSVSVIIAGHNEENAIERCVRSLWEQSRKPDEIIVVSDGSTDGMVRTVRSLQREGLVQKVHGTDLRAGKAAAVNLAAHLCSGDVVVNVDCDCSFDRHALKEIVSPFSSPNVGAVAGNILIRHQERSLWTGFQAIEYLVSISLGKRAQDMVGLVSCASGAFSAFRKSAIEAVGGLDAGGGEDLDVTLRLRKANWAIGFAHEAICYTDPPVSARALVKQRFRWERDAIRLRYRKHGALMNPFSRSFKPLELFHEMEFLLLNVVAALSLPFYFLWMFATYGDLAIPILLGAQCGLMLFDFVLFLLAAWATPKAHALQLVPYLLGYSVLFNNFLRFVRLLAYGQEWIFRSSYQDNYVPDKVHKVRE